MANLYKTLTPQVSHNDSIVNTARRAQWSLSFSGVDVTSLAKKDLISLEIKDVEDSEADDLTIKLADRDGVWLQKWLNETVQKGAAGAKGLKITPKIGIRDHTGKIVTQTTGTFILDSMEHSGPPAVATIKATSVDFKNGIRTDTASKSWKNLRLKKLTQTVAKKGGLKYYYQPKANPKFKKITQNDETMLAFLVRCCEKKGYCVKICGNNMVVYDPKSLESKTVRKTYSFGDKSYSSWKLSTETADSTYDYCTVKYMNPKTKKLVKATYKDSSYKDNSTHTGLTITNKKLTSKSAALTYAQAQLNIKNKFERAVRLTIPGDPAMMSGLTIQIKKMGYWTGKYIIHEARHSISSSGYTTTLNLRMVTS